VLDSVVIRYGGAYQVRTFSSSLAITDSVIENSSSHGIQVVNASSPAIAGNTIRNNSQHGIFLNDYCNATVINNTITGNTNNAISIKANCNPIINSNTISGNGINGISVESSSVDRAVTWGSLDAPYHVEFLLDINEGITLTINPGVVVKASGPNDAITINGTLLADGTSSDPIYFTSLQDDTVGGDTNGDGNASTPVPGDWAGLVFLSTSTDSVLDSVVVRYGGAYQVRTFSSSLTITDSIIENSSSHGIQVVNASPPTIAGNTIRNNSQYGIYTTGSSIPVIMGNAFSGNNYGIYNATSTITINAEKNYWGDPSGPYDPSNDTATGGLHNPSGLGDRVTDHVDYDPWSGSSTDKDSDGMTDDWEIENFEDLMTADENTDFDNDGLLDIDEASYDTNPRDSDTDGDGWSDHEKVTAGTDPNNPEDHPHLIPTLNKWGVIIMMMLLITIGTIIVRQRQES